MKQSSLTVSPIDYPERPLRPDWYDDYHEEQSGSKESGLSCSKRFDGEDPRFVKTSVPGVD